MNSDDYGNDRCSCTESIFSQRRLNGERESQCSLRGLPDTPTSKSRLLLQYLENQLRSTLSTQAVECDRRRISESSSGKECHPLCLSGEETEFSHRRSVSLYENLPTDLSFIGRGCRSRGCSSGSGGHDLEADGTGSGQKALSHVIRLGVRTRLSSTESEKDIEPEEDATRRYPLPASASLGPAVADHWSTGRCCPALSSGSHLGPAPSPNEEGHGRSRSPTRRELDPGECSRPHYNNLAQVVPSWDLEQLQLVHYRLAICGFYRGRMTIDEARTRLEPYPVGTFLLRDSSDPRYLFSLSVQTQRGTTSIRIVYECGMFRMDSEPEQRHLMPTFECVLRMIQYYRRLCLGRGSPVRRSSFVFLESSGRKDTRVLLRRPMEASPHCLVHLCRLGIHAVLRENGVARLPLTPSLKMFLMDYPYDV